VCISRSFSRKEKKICLSFFFFFFFFCLFVGSEKDMLPQWAVRALLALVALGVVSLVVLPLRPSASLASPSGLRRAPVSLLSAAAPADSLLAGDCKLAVFTHVACDAAGHLRPGTHQQLRALSLLRPRPDTAVFTDCALAADLCESLGLVSVDTGAQWWQSSRASGAMAAGFGAAPAQRAQGDPGAGDDNLRGALGALSLPAVVALVERLSDAPMLVWLTRGALLTNSGARGIAAYCGSGAAVGASGTVAAVIPAWAVDGDARMEMAGPLWEREATARLRRCVGACVFFFFFFFFFSPSLATHFPFIHHQRRTTRKANHKHLPNSPAWARGAFAFSRGIKSWPEVSFESNVAMPVAAHALATSG
jgi:hypothetical protein